MAESYVSYLGDGSTTAFSVTFPFLSRDFVKAYVDGSSVPFSWLTDGSILITPAPAAGAYVRVSRETPSSPLTNFTNGSTLTDADLDNAVQQSLHVAVESSERAAQSIGTNGATWDAQGKRIGGISSPVGPTDAVTKGYLDDTYLASIEASKAASEAAKAASEAASSASSTNAADAASSAAMAYQWAVKVDGPVDGSAGEYSAKHHAMLAAGYASALNMPSLGAGTSGRFPRVKTTEDGYELRSSVQLLADIGAAASGHNHSGTYEPASGYIAKVNVAQTFSAPQRGSIGTLTDAATITPDFGAYNDFTVTLAGNRTMANPSNVAAGQKGVFIVRQDATGGRGVAWGSYFKWSGGAVPTLSSPANAVDRIQYHAISATEIHCVWIGDFK